MFRFPWGDMHSLNLGWFLQKFNELREDWATAEAAIDGALDAEIQKAEDALSDVFDARDAAAASATAAAGSASSAGTNATLAQNSATAAAASATLANQKATAAGLSEAAAAQSATDAAASAATAAGSASQAAQSATNAAGSATNAAGSATAADQKATAAGLSEAAAAQSAADAAASAARAEEVEESIPEDYSELSADVVELKDTVSEIATEFSQTATARGNVVSFTSPAVDPLISWIVELPYSGSAFATQKLVHYGKNEASGRVEYDKRLTSSGTVVAGSGAFIGDIEVPEGATNIYALWRKVSSSGRTTTAWAYDENKNPISALWDNNYSSQVGYRTAALPANTKYVNIYLGLGSSEVPRGTIKVSFEMTSLTVAMPENYYGGYLDVINGKLVQLYDVDGNELVTPIETTIPEVVEYNSDTFIGENHYYDGNGSSWYSPASSRINTIEYTEYLKNATAVIKALIAPELENMTADTALVPNDFRIVNNTLYKITVAIAAGDALIPGTNCASTTITAELKRLM